MQTIYIIITLFSLAAILGMYLLSFVLRNRETPKGIAFIHGPVAAIALVILIIYSIKNDHAFTTSIVLFVMAALGGIILIVRDLSGKPLPKWLAIAHGLIAVAGFVVLLTNTFD